LIGDQPVTKPLPIYRATQTQNERTEMKRVGGAGDTLIIKQNGSGKINTNAFGKYVFFNLGYIFRYSDITCLLFIDYSV
jgi:hypothetical protein